MAYFQLFKLTIPSIWPAVILAFFVATLLYKLATSEKITDWFGNAFFTYIVVWKFSYILFYLPNFLKLPLGALYFNGGIKGHWVALLIIVLYVTFLAHKKYPQVTQQITPVLLLYVISFEFLFDLFNQNLTFAIIQIALLISIYILLMVYKQIHVQTTILLFAIELMILSLQHTLSLTKLLTYSAFIVLALTARRRKEIYDKK